METNDILMVVAILAIILFLVAVGMSYKSWRPHTLILVFLVFCAAGTQLVMAAYVLKTQQSWQEIIYGVRKPDRQKRSQGLKGNVEKVVAENQRLQEGDWPGGVLTTEGIDQHKQRIRAALLDRGSRWGNCVPTNPQADGSVQLKVPFSSPELGHLKKNRDNPLEERPRKNMIVYAFQASDIADDGTYLGEFRVEQVTVSEDAAADGANGPAFSTATLVPALPLAAEEIERVNNSEGNWIIYDKMAVDSHYLFADIEDRSKWLPATSVAEYDKDMQPAEESDPAERIEVLVRFQQDYESEVPLLVRRPGQADDEDPEEVPVTFKRNQLVWIAKETVTVGEDGDQKKILGADDLAEQGIVTIRDKVRSNFDSGVKLPGYSAPQSEDDITQVDAKPRYVRALRDYRTLFSQIRANRIRQQEAVDKIQKQTTQMVEDNNEKTKALANLKATIGRLESDASEHTKEEKVVKDHLAALEKQYKALRAKRKKLFQANARLAAELDRLEKQAAREIDRRAPAVEQTKRPIETSTR